MLFAFFPVVTLVVRGFEHFNLEVTLKQPRLLWHCLEPKEEYWGASPSSGLRWGLPYLFQVPVAPHSLKSGSRSSLNICVPCSGIYPALV